MTSTTIHTLRLRTAPGRETRSRQAALRHRASAWLNMAGLHPPDLPPAAILHVRRLPDPVVYASNASGGLRPSPEWQQAVRSVMEERLQEAKKPVRGVLSASAEAVVFANVAEQIASLSLDLVYGRVTRRWWWTPVLQSVGAAAQPLGQRLARVLTYDPDATPAVIAYLAEWGELGTVLPVISPLQAEWVLRAWTPRHGIFLPASSLSMAPEAQSDSRTQSREAAAPSPWGDIIEHALPRGLSRVHRALAGIALAWLRTPHRSGTLSRDLARWWEQREERSAANAPRQGTPDGGPFPPKAGRPEGDRSTDEVANADLSGRDRGRGQALKQVYAENPELQKGSLLNQHAGDIREEAAQLVVQEQKIASSIPTPRAFRRRRQLRLRLFLRRRARVHRSRIQPTRRIDMNGVLKSFLMQNRSIEHPKMRSRPTSRRSLIPRPPMRTSSTTLARRLSAGRRQLPRRMRPPRAQTPRHQAPIILL